MLIIEMISTNEIFEFNTNNYVLLSINKNQVVMLEVVKLLGKSDFNILVNDKIHLIQEVRIVYK